MGHDDVELVDVEVVEDTGLVLVCLIGGRRIMIPPMHIRLGSTARCVGDRGTLVLPRWLAEDLGLV